MLWCLIFQVVLVYAAVIYLNAELVYLVTTWD